MSQGLQCPQADQQAADTGLQLSEVNHRIANNLAMIASLVRMHGNEIAKRQGEVCSEEMRGFLYDISARIDVVGRLHRHLSAETARTGLDLGGYLRDLCDDLQSSLCKPGRIAFLYDFDTECRVGADHVTPLCLIVSEVVTNAIKYAHPTGVFGRIVVGCHRYAGDRLVITVTDDGIGLPEGFDPNIDGGLGFRVIRGLSRQLDARCRFESTAVGVTFRLEVG